jgi:hypothetical protein
MTDAERLNWLESHGYGLRSKWFGVRNLIVWGQYGQRFYGIRDAIDSAMKRQAVAIKGARNDSKWRNPSNWSSIKGQPF